MREQDEVGGKRRRGEEGGKRKSRWKPEKEEGRSLGKFRCC